ncbi:hypothetical protein LWT78_23475 [Enterobacter hormaechei]|nr:hypothetical protein [Enterobacter hormaechei]
MVMTIAEELKQEGRREGLEQGLEQGREQGREQGLEQGREQGREQGKLETARAFLQNGVSVDIIIRSTGLSREQIEALRH